MCYGSMINQRSDIGLKNGLSHLDVGTSLVLKGVTNGFDEHGGRITDHGRTCCRCTDQE